MTNTDKKEIFVSLCDSVNADLANSIRNPQFKSYMDAVNEVCPNAWTDLKVLDSIHTDIGSAVVFGGGAIPQLWICTLNGADYFDFQIYFVAGSLRAAKVAHIKDVNVTDVLPLMLSTVLATAN